MTTTDTLDAPASNLSFLTDVIKGLSQEPKTLPCQWLYDTRGSELFEHITDLPEYYLTRTETAILNERAPDLATRLTANTALIEYGAGASVKTRILLDAAPNLSTYVPIDVSDDFLMETAAQLKHDYPALKICPVVGSFLNVPPLPNTLPEERVGFFPGSTIGNLSDADILEFFRQSHQTLGPSAELILGFDLVKSLSILIPAYDDAAGVTAAFNMNLLTRINRELGADFDLSAFQHEAQWNDVLSRVEMHLVSQRDQIVTIGHRKIAVRASETIHTENSRKFTIQQMTDLAEQGGFEIVSTYQDDENLFAVALLKASR